jgi:hypothetical protein
VERCKRGKSAWCRLVVSLICSRLYCSSFTLNQCAAIPFPTFLYSLKCIFYSFYSRCRGRLPAELVVVIAGWLALRDVGRLSLACRTLHALLAHDVLPLPRPLSWTVRVRWRVLRVCRTSAGLTWRDRAGVRHQSIWHRAAEREWGIPRSLGLPEHHPTWRSLCARLSTTHLLTTHSLALDPTTRATHPSWLLLSVYVARDRPVQAGAAESGSGSCRRR